MTTTATDLIMVTVRCSYTTNCGNQVVQSATLPPRQIVEDNLKDSITGADVARNQVKDSMSSLWKIPNGLIEAALFERAINEAISLSDSISRFKLAIRDISQSISISDSLARIAYKFRSISQSISISDSIAKVLIRVRAISQSITISDSLARLKTAIRDLSQSITISDSLERVATKMRAISQSITVSDSITRVVTKLRSISQSISISDSLDRVATKLRSISQSITINDSVTKVSLYLRSVTQNISILDEVARQFIAGGGTLFEVACNVSIGISDSVSRVGYKFRNIAESVTISDALSKSALKFRSMVESISISSACSAIILGAGNLFHVTINETINLSDSIARIFYTITQKLGGKSPAGNIWRRKYEKQMKRWREPFYIDYKERFFKKINKRLKKLGK